jgi:hypothetical protein
MRSDAKSVSTFLASLPDERRAAVSALRELILANLPRGYEEVMDWGMICYVVPLATEPKTYNGKPLLFAAVASQKNHLSIYMNALYCLPGKEVAFRKSWAAKRKLDMGKSCIRAKSLDDLDLALIGNTIASIPVSEFVAAQKR